MICPHCNLDYSVFRTGYTYREIYYMVYGRKHKRRHGVLGAWHELKQQMFAEHIRDCEVPF